MPTDLMPYFTEPVYTAARDNLSLLLNTTIITIGPNDITSSILTQSVLVLALATALFYFAVSGYYVSNFRKLSLPFNSMDLPFSFYLHAGHWIALTILIIFIPSLYAIIFPQPIPNTILHFIILFIMFLFLIWLAWSNTNTPKWAMTLVVLIILIFVDLIKITALVGRFQASIRTPSDFAVSLSSMIMIFLLPCLLYLIFSVLGWAVAARCIRGDTDNLKIKLELKDGNYFMPDKALMLVMHSGGMYYVVERSECNPPHATSYIIPDSQIKMAIINTIEAGDIAAYHNVESIVDAYEKNDLKCTLTLIHEMLIKRAGKMDKAMLKSLVDAAVEIITKLDNRKIK